MQMYVSRRSLSGQSAARAVIALLALSYLILLSGCDIAGVQDDEAVLEYEAGAAVGEGIVFSFDPSQIETGQLVDLEAEESLDIAGFLQEQGFSKADITSATLQDANVRIVFPRSEEINFLDQAILKLTAPGHTAIELGSLSEFPTDDDANLEVLSDRDVANYLQEDSWLPVLQIDAATLNAEAGEYQLDMILTFRIEVSV